MSLTTWLYIIWTAWLLVALVSLADRAKAGMLIFFLVVTLFLQFEIGLDWRAYLVIWLLVDVAGSSIKGYLAEKQNFVFAATHAAAPCGSGFKAEQWGVITCCWYSYRWGQLSFLLQSGF
jgi:hypothetical protein